MDGYHEREIAESLSIASVNFQIAIKRICKSLKEAEIKARIFGLHLENAMDIFAHHFAAEKLN